MAKTAETLLPPGVPKQQEHTLLIADVAALTGVPPPQLRSWESAGILHPRRSPNATRLYGNEDVARVRLIKRSLRNPGRRGSLRRLAREFAAGTLAPEPMDYEGLVVPGRGAVPLTDAQYWQSVASALDDLLVVCDADGSVTSINAALQAMLSGADSARPGTQITREHAGVARSPLDMLPLRWAALTGTAHRGIALVFHGDAGTPRHTLWDVLPRRDENGRLQGAVGVGRLAPQATSALPLDGLAMAVHDLRSPVSTVLGRLQLARRAAAAPSEDRRRTVENLDTHLNMAEVSTLDLIRLMDTLLDTAAIADGALLQHLQAEYVDLHEAVRQGLEHARQHTSRHTLTLEAPAAELVVVGDRIRLRQVVDNLLSNAVKYSPDGGPIVVTLEVTARLPIIPPESGSPHDRETDDVPRWIVMRVADPGLGIPAAGIAHVFDRYWRAEGLARHIRGTGLGLYTCRALVAAHGGYLWVERTATVQASEKAGDGWHGTVLAAVFPYGSAGAPRGTDETGSKGMQHGT